MRRTTRAQTAIRDIAICERIAQGLSERAVARMFGVAPSTVNRAVHRQIKHLVKMELEQAEIVRRVEERFKRG